jgi:hypothetical protein
VDSAFQLCSIKNLIVLPSKEAKENFINIVYPHFIDCIVISQDEADKYKGNYKVAFIGCFLDQYADCENIILDEILYARFGSAEHKILWNPESFATFLSKWFSQGKLRKMKNNLLDKFERKEYNESNKWIGHITKGNI